MNRPDLDVVARFLESLWLKGGGEMRRYDLQMSVKVNYNVFTKYLQFLAERGLLNEHESGGERVVRITAKGVDAYKAILHIVKDVFKQV